MSRKRTQKIYFGEAQEEAVIRYLLSESGEEKNKIFNEYLRDSLVTMVESIIRRYKLYRKDIEFNDLRSDTISFLFTKLNKFDSNQNTKAYSYFGTICKNYLMGAIQKDSKDQNRSVSYEDISSDIEDSHEMSYIMDEAIIDYKDVISKMILNLEEYINYDDLTENERKLAYALLEIFENFESTFQIGNGNKFNKNLILLSLREMTSLSTKEIRISLKRFKKLYDGIILDFIN